jgi:UDP-2,3-diacylglucosamine hydrolase
MSEERVWFVSDLHLLSEKDERYLNFCKFLEDREGDGSTSIVLVGDIFDLWFGPDRFFANRFPRVCQIVSRLTSSGLNVHFFEGNHDLHLTEIWQNELGAIVHDRAKYFDFGPWRVRVEHGDQMNPDDRGYLILRQILRSRPLTWFAKNLPGESIQLVGDRMSRTSRKWTSSNSMVRDEESIRKMIRSHAARAYEEEPFDFLISGHVHVRDDFTWNPRESEEARSLNLGSWLGPGPAFALMLDSQGVHWREPFKAEA